MNWPKVSIIILNWNGWKDTIECMESLFQISYPKYDVILIDNNSSDDSVDKIKEYIIGNIKIDSKFFTYNPANKPIEHLELSNVEATESIGFSSLDKLIIIKNDENYGFAEGNNIGIRFALDNLKPDYILLLNNDTVVTQHFLDNLVYVGEKDAKIGIVGPLICLYDDPLKIWALGGKANLLTGDIGNREVGKNPQLFGGIKLVDYVTGCALLIKTSLLEKIGLLDTVYYLYFEETDLNFRAKRLGYLSIIDCDAIIYHKAGASVKKVKDINYYYFSRNKIIFMHKNAPWPYLIFFIPLFLLNSMIIIISSILNKRYNRIHYILGGLFDGTKYIYLDLVKKLFNKKNV